MWGIYCHHPKLRWRFFDCARGWCPAYFSDICVPVHSVAGRSRLRSADHGDLIVPRVQTQCYGSRSFRVSGPTVWNSLPQNLRSSDISRNSSSVDLRHGCLSVLMCRWCIWEFFIEDALYKFTFWLIWLICPTVCVSKVMVTSVIKITFKLTLCKAIVTCLMWLWHSSRLLIFVRYYLKLCCCWMAHSVISQHF